MTQTATPTHTPSGAGRRFARLNLKERPTYFLPAPPTIGELIETVGLHHGAEEGRTTVRVYLTGARPGGTLREMVAWFTTPAPAGWGSRWRPDPERPVATFTREGLTVEVRRAAEWFPEDATPGECHRAWGELRELIRDTFAGGLPLSTPALTGLDLWDRAQQHHRPALPAEVRELIRSTTGQGRIEVTTGAGGTIPGLWHYDSRWAYAALGGDTLPVTFVGRDTGGEFLGYTPARYRVEFAAPPEWDHVGLLPVRRDGAWTYPREGEAWVDGCELHMAERWGWHYTIRERLVFSSDNARPLDRWRGALIRIMGRTTSPRVQRAVRAILLAGIGAFARRERSEVVILREGERLADSLRSRVLSEYRVGDTWHVKVSAPLSAWSERFSHPEWSAHVWARQRCRILDGPGVKGERVGALWVPRHAVLALETDGLYLACDPGWKDDGAVGRMRLKSVTRGPLEAPRSWVELHAARAAGGEV